MKTQTSNTVILYFSLVLLLGITACRSKYLSKQTTRASDRQTQDIAIKNKHDESYQHHRIILMSDSGNHQYRINIFPKDSFSFSMEGGFKGKASRIEIIGTANQVRGIYDSSSFIVEKRKETEYDLKSESRETAVSNVKTLEKSKAGRIGIWVGLAGLLGWMGWRFWKGKFREHQNRMLI